MSVCIFVNSKNKNKNNVNFYYKREREMDKIWKRLDELKAK
jgi:hypothetical protein